MIPNQVASEERKLTAHEQWLLADLTVRERDLFTLVKAEGLTYEYTAELLELTKSSVQTCLERTERKIVDQKNGSLFLVS